MATAGLLQLSRRKPARVACPSIAASLCRRSRRRRSSRPPGRLFAYCALTTLHLVEWWGQAAALLLVASGLFLNPRLERGRESQAVRNNLYSLCCDAIEERFSAFYHSFATVMGAQIIISAINTVFTAVFVTAMHLPYALVVIGGTF